MEEKGLGDRGQGGCYPWEFGPLVGRERRHQSGGSPCKAALSWEHGAWGPRPRMQGVAPSPLSALDSENCPGNKCYQLRALFYIICTFLISNTCTQRARWIPDFVFIALCVPFMPLSSPALLAPQEILERGQPL